ncbi:MAG: DUF6166 domain-containing protein [Ginsengibacter sp.]
MIEIKTLPTDILITGNYETGVVQIFGKELLPDKSQKVRNHSPDGFSWGYGGSGPAQLALAILLEYMSVEDAGKYYQEFKRTFVSNLPNSDFPIDLNLQQEIKNLTNYES